MWLPTSDPSKQKNIWIATGVAAVCGALALTKYLFTRFAKVTRDFDKDVTQYSSPVTVPGLRSSGVTCFLNATLQALSACPSFEAYLRQVMPYVSSDRLVNALFQIIVDRYPNIDTFNRSVGTRMSQFIDGQQHDAQEFLTCLLDAVESAVQDGHKVAVQARAKAVQAQKTMDTASAAVMDTADGTSAGGDAAAHTSDTSACVPPAIPFQGKEAYVRRCMACSYAPPPAHTPFHITSLALFPSPTSIPLQALLDQYMVSERISDVTCEVCTLRTRLRQIDVAVRGLAADVQRATADTMVDEQVAAVLAGTDATLSEEDESEACMLQRLKQEGRDTQLALNKLLPDTCPPHTLHTPDVSETFFRQLPAWAPLVPSTPVKTTSERRLTISTLPPLLCLHFKRLTGMRKCESHIAFPLHLNLADLHRTRRRKANLPLSGPADADAHRYALKAVVVHLGDAYGGHYITYRQSADTYARESVGRGRVYAHSQRLGRSVPVYGHFRVDTAAASAEGEVGVGSACIRVLGDVLAGNDITDAAEIEQLRVDTPHTPHTNTTNDTDTDTNTTTAGACDARSSNSNGSDSDSGSGRRWWLCSDLDVREVREQDVLRQNAYMLFYERV